MVNKIELVKMSQEALINYIEQLITRIERLELDNQQLRLDNQQLKAENQELRNALARSKKSRPSLR